GPVLRGHRGQRGGGGHAAVPAGRAGAPRPAAAAETRGGAGLLGRRGDQLPANVAAGGPRGGRVAPPPRARAPGRALAPRGGGVGMVLGYVLITELVVAGLAFLLSVSTDSPLGAVGGAVGLVIVSDILDAVTALGGWRRVLPSHWQFAWLDAMQPQISWGGMLE